MNCAVIFNRAIAAALAGLALVSLKANAPKEFAARSLTPPSRPTGQTLFTELAPEITGIVAPNRYADPRMWGERFRQFEVGAIGIGVAVGDYNGDGRPDIFVVGKTDSCRLFRNLGDWRFADVSESAGIIDRGEAAGIWKQGVAFADVNNDGHLDLYVCRFDAPNLLYMNRGDGTFREEARMRGLAVVDASNMAAFCDYDRDGWLDVYVQTNFRSTERPDGQPDYLFRNNGNGTFTEVTAAAGIAGDGYGHSATWWDYDNDGWPDLYVANDFAARDRLYHNNRDGTFTDVIDRVVPHVPYSAMGSDLGDVNNDGLPDFLVAEMAATTHEKDLRTMAEVRSRAQDPADDSRTAPQYYYNALFLNTGTGRCQEAAFLTGLAATDWTWSVRFEDLDNDGRIDLHVTNGMFREIHNTDLMQRMLASANPAERMRISQASPVLTEKNLAYRNHGNLTFEEVGEVWGLNHLGVSFGAAFGDLDGDGDLDLVVAHYQENPTVSRNDSITGNRLTIRLRGTRSNRFGVGARVTVETAAGRQVRDLVLARGYLSTSEPMLHFGLGEESIVSRLVVDWPGGARQTFERISAGQDITITEPAGDVGLPVASPENRTHFTEMSEVAGLNLKVPEAIDDELAAQPLLPRRLNRAGPVVAAGDIDGDGRDDLVLGGSTLEAPRVLIQTVPGRFAVRSEPSWAFPRAVTGGPLLLFDANGDGRTDLLETYGGGALVTDSSQYQPRLWWGTEQGFRASSEATLPPLEFSVGAAAVVDFDRDGNLDIFLGGRVVPGEYPMAPPSALLANRGGRFEDVTDTLAPALHQLGLVTSACWSDVDVDGWPDLLVTLEWGGVRYYRNQDGRGFEDRSEAAGFAGAGHGWWTSIAAADLNSDGTLDYVVGNVGLNTPYRASVQQPALLFYGQFNEGSAPDLVEGHYEGERLLPRRVRRQLGLRNPGLLRRFATNDRYARATLPELLGADRLAAADKWAATELRSGVFLSQPKGGFHFSPLPREAQLAPLQGIVAGDFDGDGKSDVVAVQNSFAPTPVVGRFDGGLGVFLRGDGRGGLEATSLAESGFVVPRDAKALAVLDLDADGRPDLFATRNNDTALAFRQVGEAARRFRRVIFSGQRGNPTAIGARVQAELADGTLQLAEIAAGAGWMSQSVAAAFFCDTAANPVRRIRVRWPSGRETEHEPDKDSATIALAEP